MKVLLIKWKWYDEKIYKNVIFFCSFSFKNIGVVGMTLGSANKWDTYLKQHFFTYLFHVNDQLPRCSIYVIFLLSVFIFPNGDQMPPESVQVDVYLLLVSSVNVGWIYEPCRTSLCKNDKKKTYLHNRLKTPKTLSNRSWNSQIPCTKPNKITHTTNSRV